MTLDVHRPYPGVALCVTDKGSVLLGAPADAFKATKSYCTKNKLPFPRILVAPQRLLANANPQFAPEFFLYDFLFVYGQAFKPELDAERLQLVLDKNDEDEERRALTMTLTGPTRDELSSYKDDKGKIILLPETIKQLADVSEHLAMKKGPRPRVLEDMIETPTFDSSGEVTVLDGALRITRTGPQSFRVRASGEEKDVDLSFEPPVVPFATLPMPSETQLPMTFGVKSLGNRSGFDLSGPTTGFLFWLNGRAVMYDGPVGTRYLLEQAGISTGDLDAVILSHCHEDHMGAFVELILAGHRPKVFTAEPIYRSMLAKLAHHFRLTEQQAAAFIDYQRVTPGEPIDAFGARFDFFYTVHTIPTIGMRVSMKSASGQEHSVQISGDTMHHDGLDKMHDAKVIGDETWQRMKNLVPPSKVDGAMYLADVGEAIIHGHPKDWQGNPNRVVYYHCPENDHTKSFGHELAQLGKTYALIDAPTLHPATPGRLLHALRFLDLDDPAWFASILFRGTTRRATPGEVLVEAGTDAKRISVIVGGAAKVTNKKGDLITTLRPGEFFGVIELVGKDGKSTATVTAETPMELFDIDASLFHEYITATDKTDVVKKLWMNRPMVDGAKIFRSLDISLKSQIAGVGSDERFPPGAVIFTQGQVSDDFFLLAEGKVAVEVGGKVVRELDAKDDDNFFGEIAAVSPNRPRNATIRAVTAVRALKVRGPEMRQLFNGDMGVRYSVVVAIEDRNG